MISNTAIASGSAPNGDTVTSPVSSVTVSVPVLPPINLEGLQKSNKFATQTELVNILTWEAPRRGVPPVAYKIFRDRHLTHLVDKISSRHHLIFKDHNRQEGKTYHYHIVSVDAFGNVSAPATVTIKGHD